MMRAGIIAFVTGFLLWYLFGVSNPYETPPTIASNQEEPSAIAKSGDEVAIANQPGASGASESSYAAGGGGSSYVTSATTGPWLKGICNIPSVTTGANGQVLCTSSGIPNATGSSNTVVIQAYPPPFFVNNISVAPDPSTYSEKEDWLCDGSQARCADQPR